MKRLKLFLERDEAATAAEYALMAALIAVVIVGAVTVLGTNVSSLFQSAATGVANAS